MVDESGASRLENCKTPIRTALSQDQMLKASYESQRPVQTKLAIYIILVLSLE